MNELNPVQRIRSIIEQARKQAAFDVMARRKIAWEVGKALDQVKGTLAHGEFEKWIQSHFRNSGIISPRMAQNWHWYYTKTQRVEDLSQLPSVRSINRKAPTFEEAAEVEKALLPSEKPFSAGKEEKAKGTWNRWVRDATKALDRWREYWPKAPAAERPRLAKYLRNLAAEMEKTT